MIEFWLVVAALIVVALGFVLYPLWRQHRLSGRWSRAGILAAVAVVPIAFGVYYQIRTYDPELDSRAATEHADQVALINLLAERMQANPDDVRGWRLLGRSYAMLGLYQHALDAYSQAWKRTPNPDSSLMLDYAEAQVLVDRTSLEGEAGKLIGQVLAAQPDSPKALWYGGQRALALGKYDVARTRLDHLLALGVPADVANVVRKQLASIPESAAAGSPSEDKPVAPVGVSVRIDVRLGSQFSAKDLKPDAALFIFASAPSGGPPVAVLRAPASKIPGDFVLSDANAMVPGRSLGDFAELKLVARISATHQPMEQPGDLYAEEAYRPGKDTTAQLIIDKIAK